ncbi:hypothetical protein DTO045G8_694 [Paecilomyces variotii]|nr:hypothetical protein DTO045G8_694 [Paecilomyces variotii]
MNGHQHSATDTSVRLFSEDSVSLAEFEIICSQTTRPETYPLAAAIEKNIPIYELSTPAPDHATAARLQDEWYHILHSGPGVFVLKGMYAPSQYGHTLAAASDAFQQIVKREREAATAQKGDHFAAGGRNDRIWNSFSKHALEDPASFVDYYSNPWLALVCDAWLGPGYRVTAQVNVVKPGGAAQNPHRDYHLGFQDFERSLRFPRSAHVNSQFLTLQGAVAHSAMPIESGPTRLLPFSQKFPPGFLAYRREDFQAFFQKHYVALPLGLGDGIFFNPAIFHAAGANETPLEGNFHRSANLLQISSPFGKPMETVDAIPLVAVTWDILTQKYISEGKVLSERIKSFVQSVAEGYPFPTNLDNRPPAPSGMAPESEQELLLRALQEGWDTQKVVGELKKMRMDAQP